MTNSIHYLNGQEAASEKLGLATKVAAMDLHPLEMRQLALRAAGGTLGGAALGAAAGGEDNRLTGALAGGAVGGLSAGALSLLNKAYLRDAQNLRHLDDKINLPAPGENPYHDFSMKRVDKAWDAISNGTLGSNIPATMAGGAAMGAVPAMAAGRMMRDPEQKVAFLGLDPAAMKHVGLRAAGGAAAGAGVGAVAGGEDNRLQGALAGGVTGGLGGGAASLASKLRFSGQQNALANTLAELKRRGPLGEEFGHRMLSSDPDFMQEVQEIRNNQHRINQGLTGSGIGKTVAGGAALGGISAIQPGRATRDE